MGLLRQGAHPPCRGQETISGHILQGRVPWVKTACLGLAEAPSNLRFCDLTTQHSLNPTMSQGQKSNPRGQSAYSVPNTGLPVHDLTHCHNKPVRKESFPHQREGKQARIEQDCFSLPPSPGLPPQHGVTDGESHSISFSCSICT